MHIRAVNSSGPRVSWSYGIQHLIDLAKEAGYRLEPHGKPPWGWDLRQGGKVIVANADFQDVKKRAEDLGII